MTRLSCLHFFFKEKSKIFLYHSTKDADCMTNPEDRDQTGIILLLHLQSDLADNTVNP